MTVVATLALLALFFLLLGLATRWVAEWILR